jgi:HSP20 family protein
MTISLWNPETNVPSARQVAQQLFDQGVWWPMRHEHGTLSTPMDVYTDGDGYVVEVALPGVKPEEIDIQLTGNMLTISGEFTSAAPEGRRYLMCQRQTGPFQKSLALPDAADSAQITATFEHGVLRLEVPKSEASKPKRIALKSAD